VTGTAVDRVLAQRARLQEGSRWGSSLSAAALLHVLLAAAFVLLPAAFNRPPAPLEFVPVTVIPAAALGVPNPRRAAPPKPPEPEPAAEEPEEVKEPEPEPPEDVPALPSKEPEKPTPAREQRAAREDEAKPSRQPAAADARSQGSERGTGPAGERRGSPEGSRSGTTAFGGSEIAGVDPDFTYGYYLDRLLSLIDANWQRPPVGGGVKAVLFFRIEKDGSVTELQVEQSSGMNAFDLAALRAVQNAAPFPRLPASYRHSSLGVNLIVR
jgi:TonB family protein